MKKKFMMIVFAALLCLSLFLCSACDPDLLFRADSSYPYEAAVSRGEEGSRESWLASLDSSTSAYRLAYEEACSDGSFEGTYFEFLQTLDLEGDGAFVQQALRSVVSVFSFFHPADSKKDDYYSVGSGVVYSLDREQGNAYLVTNYHVVYNINSNGKESLSHVSDRITVKFYGSSEEIAVKYMGGAMKYDIAVLSVENCDFLKSDFVCEAVGGNSDAVTVGERVYAIGNADGEGMSVTEGVVSVESEYINVRSADEKSLLELLEIRTDASVNHGNSGGGLFDAFGKLVGIVNARGEKNGVVGFGYAIPANLALSLAQNIIDACTADPRAYGGALAQLGVTVRSDGKRPAFDEQTGKVYIEEKIVLDEVQYRKAADRAGLKPEDTLISAKLTSSRGGEPYERTVEITRMYKITNLLFEARRGDTLEITYSRDDELHVCTVVFTESSDFLLLN